jgi:hypothetical protein
MKVFVLYILGDYAQAIFMSKYKDACEAEKQKIIKRGITRSMWIEEYDFSRHNSFELDSD